MEVKESCESCESCELLQASHLASVYIYIALLLLQRSLLKIGYAARPTTTIIFKGEWTGHMSHTWSFPDDWDAGRRTIKNISVIKSVYCANSLSNNAKLLYFHIKYFIVISYEKQHCSGPRRRRGPTGGTAAPPTRAQLFGWHPTPNAHARTIAWSLIIVGNPREKPTFREKILISLDTSVWKQ